MSTGRMKRSLATLGAFTAAAVLLGGPAAAASSAAGTDSHATTAKPASIKCDEAPPECNPDICFCPQW